MPTATISIDGLIRQHADNIACVAEMTTPATNLAEFTRHLDYAADNFDLASINGHDDLKTASTLLTQATTLDGNTQETLLRRTAVLLRIVPEMTDEYRCMVGD